MQVRAVLVCAIVVVSGCGKKSNCDKWLAMQQKCDGDRVGDKDQEIEMCKGIETGDGSDARYYKRTHDCAAETEDCAVYAKCLDAARAQKDGAPAAEAAEATEIALAILEGVTKVANTSDECGTQLARVEGVLKSLQFKPTRLKELIKNKQVGEAVTSSKRFERKFEALKKGTSCPEVPNMIGRVIADPSYMP